MNINLMSFSMKKLGLQPRHNREVGITRSTLMVSLTPEVLASIWWAVHQKNRPRARICCLPPSAVGALDDCASDDAPQIFVQTPTASQIWVKGFHSMSAVKVICSWGCHASLRHVWIWLGHLHRGSDDQMQHTTHFTFYIAGGLKYWPWMTWWKLLLVFSVEIYSTCTHRLLLEVAECSKTKRKKYYSQIPMQTVVEIHFKLLLLPMQLKIEAKRLKSCVLCLYVSSGDESELLWGSSFSSSLWCAAAAEW